MKKVILIIFVIVILFAAGGGGFYVYIKETTKPVIRTTLSERSREFIASQSGQRNDDWRSVNLEKKRAGESDFDSNRIVVENCYSVIVPFRVSDSRKNDPCVYYAILESPRGSMTTNLRVAGFSKAEDAPDVTFRRSKKDQYKESSIQTKNGTFLIFTDVTTGTEKTAFGMIDGKLFTVSFAIGASDELQMKQMKKIIDSLETE